MQTALDTHRNEAGYGMRTPRRRRRRTKATVAEILHRSLQHEYQAISMLRLAAQKTHGPVSSLFRRIAREEEYQLEYFRDWYDKLPEAAEDQQRLDGDRQMAEMAVEVQLSKLPDDNRTVLDFVLTREVENRDFYLKQRQEARGKKLRTILLDLADEENIHIEMLRQAAGLPPEPRMALEDM